MKGFMKKILSAGLAFALVFTMCPVLAYADTPQEAQEKDTQRQMNRKQRLRRLKQKSADEKNTVLVYGRIEVHSTRQRIISIIL